MPVTAEVHRISFCRQQFNNLRITLDMIQERVNTRLAKVAGKLQLLCRCQGLVAEENDLVFQKGLLDFLMQAVTQRTRQVYAENLCANRTGEWTDFKLIGSRRHVVFSHLSG